MIIRPKKKIIRAVMIMISNHYLTAMQETEKDKHNIHARIGIRTRTAVEHLPAAPRRTVVWLHTNFGKKYWKRSTYEGRSYKATL